MYHHALYMRVPRIRQPLQAPATVQAAVGVLQAWWVQLSLTGGAGPPPDWPSADGSESAAVHGLLARLQDLQWLCTAREQCGTAIHDVHDGSLMRVAFQEASTACAAAVARLAALPYDVLDPKELSWHHDLERVAAEVRCCL